MPGALKRTPDVVGKPWGHEEIFARTDRYVGKFLFVKAGEALSLQYHRRKDETLALLQGRIRLLIEEEGRLVERLMEPGDAYHIPPGTQHRLEALSDSRLVEVSTPELDDVVRLEDRYGRAASGRAPGQEPEAS